MKLRAHGVASTWHIVGEGLSTILASYCSPSDMGDTGSREWPELNMALTGLSETCSQHILGVSRKESPQHN